MYFAIYFPLAMFHNYIIQDVTVVELSFRFRQVEEGIYSYGCQATTSLFT